MKSCLKFFANATAAAALFVTTLGAGFANAQDGAPLRVLTAGAFKQVVLSFVPAFEASNGVKVEVQNDTAGGLLKRVAAGEAFDVIFLTPAGLVQLSKDGKVDAASVAPVAKVAIGVAVKTGQPQPAMKSVDDFKDALRNAKKIAYIDPASGGSSGIYLSGLFQRLGIADEVKTKAVLVPGGYAAERVANGQADLAIHQVSEILPVAGVTLVGTLPEEIQNYTTYSFAISAQSKVKVQAANFISVFTTREASEVIRAKGMQPVR